MIVGSGLKIWQLAVLLLVMPPIGAYAICLRPDIPKWAKLCAASYSAAVIILLLCVHPPAGEVIIDAEPWNGIR